MKQKFDICKIYPSKKVDFWNSLIRLTRSKCSNNNIICAISQQELKLSNNYPILDGVLLFSSNENFFSYGSKVYLFSRNKSGPKPRLLTTEPTVISYIPSVLSDPSTAIFNISYKSFDKKNSTLLS